MHPVLTLALRSLHPLEIITASAIIKRFFGGQERYRVILRNRVKRELKTTPPGFPPFGDQRLENSPIGYYGFRWIASTVKKTPPRPLVSFPMDTHTMAKLFPDLREKLLLLPIVVVDPHHFHEFLAAIHVWNLTVPKPRRRIKKRFDGRPFIQNYVGVSP